MNRAITLLAALLTVVAFLTPSPASAQSVGAPLSAETSRALAEIGQDIEALRIEMGRSETPLPKLLFQDASIYDLFHASLSLRERANDLYFEWTRELLPPLETAHAIPGEKEFLRNLESVLLLLGEVAQEIGVTLPVPPEKGDSLDNDQGLVALFHLNRRLNAIMIGEVGPGEVFGKVTLAVKFASNLLGNYPVSRRIPSDEPPVSRKRPVDVYERLVGCLAIAGAIVETVGQKPLKIVESDFSGITVMPGDVYDLAALNIGQLDRISHHSADEDHGYLLSYVGPRIPSQVFRRVGLLETQLNLLRKVSAEDVKPSLLNRP